MNAAAIGTMQEFELHLNDGHHVAHGMRRALAMAAASQVALDVDCSGPRVLREPRRETESGKVGGVVVAARPGRNEPCPCGSGRKHKRCCGGAND